MIPDWWVVVSFSIAYHVECGVVYAGSIQAHRCPSRRYDSELVLRMPSAWVVQMVVRFPIPLLGLGPWAVGSLNHRTLGMLSAVGVHPHSRVLMSGLGTLHRLPLGLSEY
jgi:hypothetical protein